jgi:hypothetical protein
MYWNYCMCITHYEYSQTVLYHENTSIMLELTYCIIEILQIYFRFYRVGMLYISFG